MSRKEVRIKAAKVEKRRKIIQCLSAETTNRNGEKNMGRCVGGAKLDFFYCASFEELTNHPIGNFIYLDLRKEIRAREIKEPFVCYCDIFKKRIMFYSVLCLLCST